MENKKANRNRTKSSERKMNVDNVKDLGRKPSITKQAQETARTELLNERFRFYSYINKKDKTNQCVFDLAKVRVKPMGSMPAVLNEEDSLGENDENCSTLLDFIKELGKDLSSAVVLESACLKVINSDKFIVIKANKHVINQQPFCIFSFMDISYKYQLEKQSNDQNSNISRLSHIVKELRQPLDGIQMITRFIKNQVPESSILIKFFKSLSLN